jgi:hypothetical protein
MTNEEGKDSFTIRVRRHPNDWQTAEYPVERLHGFRWDSVSGGVQVATPYTGIFAYAMCNEMTAGEIAHSCSHGPPPHRIKVYVVKKLNKDHWKQILELVGPRPGLPKR